MLLPCHVVWVRIAIFKIVLSCVFVMLCENEPYGHFCKLLKPCAKYLFESLNLHILISGLNFHVWFLMFENLQSTSKLGK